mmetsp:Transcript_24864/g.45018  ORF Transcript_24864/g.45018 Transcript_24864/m.45018 type:complete len:226 (-) Transcript_24864:183-860(-)
MSSGKDDPPSSRRRLNFDGVAEAQSSSSSARSNVGNNNDDDDGRSPQMVASHTITSSPKSRNRQSKLRFETPPPKRTRLDRDAKNVETPNRPDRTPQRAPRRSFLDLDDDDTKYPVPIYLHNNLEYQTRGKVKLDEAQTKVYHHVIDHYQIPKDFERNISYGPLSGSSFEERVMSAYSQGRLHRKEEFVIDSDDNDGTNETNEETKICSYCGETGHMRHACRKLI